MQNGAKRFGPNAVAMKYDAWILHVQTAGARAVTAGQEMHGICL